MGWLTAVLGGVSSFFSARSKEKERKAASKDEYMWGARLSDFESKNEYYYKQLDKDEMRRGANEYAKFSSLDKWAPEYQQTFKPNPVPTKPKPEDYD